MTPSTVNLNPFKNGREIYMYAMFLILISTSSTWTPFNQIISKTSERYALMFSSLLIGYFLSFISKKWD